MMVPNGAASGSSRTLMMRHPLGAHVVFGLEWMPIVGGDPEKLGRRRARSLRSTHYLVMGEPGAVVGYCVLNHGPSHKKLGRVERVRPLYSAAAMFASRHSSGVTVGIYHHSESGYWMVAVNAGRVLAQTDRWFVTLDEANAAVMVLRTRFPGLQILAMHSLAENALPEWINESLNEAASLKEGARLKNLSASGVLVLRCGLALVFTSCAYVFWTNLNPAPVQPLPSAERAETQWRDVMTRFASMHPIHRTAHIFQVLGAWQRAPLNPNGWKLNRIICESSHLDWHCAARYQRLRRFARSEQLDAVKPDGWSIDLIDMDQAALRWSVVGAASVFEPVSSSIPLKEWMSYLQGVTPVFESIQVGSGTQIIFPAPLDERGVALERPAFIKPMKRRSLSIKGPLRSMSALKGLTVPVRWRSIHLEIGARGKPGISSSELMVHLLGEVFEIAE